MSKGEHRIQIRLDEDRWRRAELAAKRNGLTYVSALCEMLLEKEWQRLGIDEAKPAARETEEEDRRLNVRVKGGLWARARERAEALGLGSVSDYCRALMERDVAEAGVKKRRKVTKRRTKK